MSQSTKQHRKEYRQNNKEKLKEKAKVYYEKNKDTIREKSRIHRLTINRKYTNYKSNAKKRGMEFSLTKAEFETFWQQPCSYCGCSIDAIGVDRADNSIGYQLYNCIPCCYMCNMMKLDYTKKEWFDHMIKILKKEGVKI